MLIPKNLHNWRYSIFVATDSAGDWVNQKYSNLINIKTKRVSGCPPDYFSKDGQLWECIVWLKYLKNKLWLVDKRIAYCFEIYDIVRIDHFRGFEAYWSIPSKDTTAVRGHWEKVWMDFSELLKED